MVQDLFSGFLEQFGMFLPVIGVLIVAFIVGMIVLGSVGERASKSNTMHAKQSQKKRRR